MNTKPPFPLPPLPGLSLLQTWVESVQLPAWVIDEIQNRVVLLLNHVMMQEPAALERIRRQKGKSASLAWGRVELTLTATAAGLFERQPYAGPREVGTSSADLTVTVRQAPLADILQAVARGDKPAVAIEGDVQLAAEVAWLVDNVRWDIEEDLSRVVGDVPAHTLVRVLGVAGLALKTFASRMPGSASIANGAP